MSGLSIVACVCRPPFGAAIFLFATTRWGRRAQLVNRRIILDQGRGSSSGINAFCHVVKRTACLQSCRTG